MTDFQAGKAGEHLVISELLSLGYEAFMAGEGLPYDIVFEKDNSIVRVQVKTSRKPSITPQKKRDTTGYIYHIKRNGKGGKKEYAINSIDCFAIVALDTKEIGYIKLDEVKSTLVIRPTSMIGTYNGESDKKEQIKKLREDGYTYQQIKEKLEVDIGYAHRVVNGKENKKVQGLYFEDLKLERIINDL